MIAQGSEWWFLAPALGSIVLSFVWVWLWAWWIRRLTR